MIRGAAADAGHERRVARRPLDRASVKPSSVSPAAAVVAWRRRWRRWPRWRRLPSARPASALWRRRWWWPAVAAAAGGGGGGGYRGGGGGGGCGGGGGGGVGGGGGAAVIAARLGSGDGGPMRDRRADFSGGSAAQVASTAAAAPKSPGRASRTARCARPAAARTRLRAAQARLRRRSIGRRSDGPERKRRRFPPAFLFAGRRRCYAADARSQEAGMKRRTALVGSLAALAARRRPRRPTCRSTCSSCWRSTSRDRSTRSRPSCSAAATSRR